MTAHLVPDPIPHYPHPFAKRIDAIPACPGTYEFYCANDLLLQRLRGRITSAANRSGVQVKTKFDKCTRVLTVIS